MMLFISIQLALNSSQNCIFENLGQDLDPDKTIVIALNTMGLVFTLTSYHSDLWD